MISRFLDEESGTTAIEYGLIASLVAVAIIGALELLGVSIDGLYEWVKDKFTAAMPT